LTQEEISQFLNKIILGDSRKIPLPDGSIDMIITSPPYWGLRFYGVKGQLGLETTFEQYIDSMLEVTKELKRVLKRSGSFYLNIGDVYAGGGGNSSKYSRGPNSVVPDRPEQFPEDAVTNKPQSVLAKSLCFIPERLAIRMEDEQQWICRNKIIWHKPNAMPSSVKDRLSPSWEYLFHFVKNSDDILWRNNITKEWRDAKPEEKQWVKDGVVTDIYEWWCNKCSEKGNDYKSRRKHVSDTRDKGHQHNTSGLQTLWSGYDSYYDLDAIRVPHEVVGVTDMRPMGILRQKLYKGSRYNNSDDPHLAQYQGKFDGSDDHESFGSPRARTQRNKDLKEFFNVKGQGANLDFGGLASDEGSHYSTSVHKYEETEEIYGQDLGNRGRTREHLDNRKQDNVPGRNAPTYDGFNDRYRPKFNVNSIDELKTIKSKLHVGDRIIYRGEIYVIWRPNSHKQPKSDGRDETMSIQGNYDELPVMMKLLGKNPGDFIEVNTQPLKLRHFASFPERLLLRPILSSTPSNGIVFDPFMGSGTTALVCEKINRKRYSEMNRTAKAIDYKLKWVGMDLSDDYIQMAYKRLKPILDQSRLDSLGVVS